MTIKYTKMLICVIMTINKTKTSTSNLTFSIYLTMNTTVMTDIILAVISPSQYQWWEIGKRHGVGKNMVTICDVMPEVAKHHGYP